MTDAARHVLNQAILKEERDIPLDGWNHYFTAVGDDGVSKFSYDRAPEDGAGWLEILVGEDGPVIDWTASMTPHDAWLNDQERRAGTQ